MVTAGYAGATWLLDWALHSTAVLFSQNQYWLLIGISSIGTLLVLRPRIHLLRIGKNERLRQLFYIIALATTSLVAGNAAWALVEITRPLVVLNSVYELPRHPKNAAYVIRHLYLATTRLTSEKEYSIGKGESTTLKLYITAPLLRTAADTAHAGAYAWLVDVQQITKKGSRSEDDYANFQAFISRSIAEFSTQSFTYLVRARPVAGLQAAARQHPAAARLTTDPVLLLARHEPYSQRAAEPLRWAKKTLFFGGGAFLLLLFCFPFSEHRLQKYQETGCLPTDADHRQLMAFLRPRPGFRFTQLLLALNLAVFALMVASGLGVMEFGTADLIRWGGGYGPATRAGEWWRLLTGAFVHAGLLHLLHTLWALGFAGWALERVAGGRRLALVYGLAVVASGLASLWWMPQGLRVGASGGIMGLYGFGLVLAWRAKKAACR